MIWDVDAGWLLMAFGAVAAFSFMLALLLEHTMRSEGFGPFGNAALITIGFFLGIAAVNYQGFAIPDLKHALMIGLGGSFVLMFSTLVIRGVWARF
jgi:hypothetical protein